MGSLVVNHLSKKAFRRFIKFHLFLGVMIFLPAWSLRFWEGWVYWSLYSVSSLLIMVHFLKYDPRLIKRRLEVGPGAERRRSQVIIQSFASLMLIVLFILSGLDHRLHWSPVPIPIVLTADLLVLLGFLIIFFVFRENSYASGVVTVEADQQVISTGPYRLVRHPMYVGVSLVFLATPLALGSLWAFVPAVSFCGMLVIRLLDEERFLLASLPGYGSYCDKVRFRLVPLVW
jgi:protein-S-isoprenylcysteine O-methyltransferase Ste14